MFVETINTVVFYKASEVCAHLLHVTRYKFPLFKKEKSSTYSLHYFVPLIGDVEANCMEDFLNYICRDVFKTLVFP